MCEAPTNAVLKQGSLVLHAGTWTEVPGCTRRNDAGFAQDKHIWECLKMRDWSPFCRHLKVIVMINQRICWFSHKFRRNPYLQPQHVLSQSCWESLPEIARFIQWETHLSRVRSTWKILKVKTLRCGGQPRFYYEPHDRILTNFKVKHVSSAWIQLGEPGKKKHLANA